MTTREDQELFLEWAYGDFEEPDVVEKRRVPCAFGRPLRQAGQFVRIRANDSNVRWPWCVGEEAH